MRIAARCDTHHSLHEIRESLSEAGLKSATQRPISS